MGIFTAIFNFSHVCNLPSIYVIPNFAIVSYQWSAYFICWCIIWTEGELLINLYATIGIVKICFLINIMKYCETLQLCLILEDILYLNDNFNCYYITINSLFFKYLISLLQSFSHVNILAWTTPLLNGADVILEC